MGAPLLPGQFKHWVTCAIKLIMHRAQALYFITDEIKRTTKEPKIRPPFNPAILRFYGSLLHEKGGSGPLGSTHLVTPVEVSAWLNSWLRDVSMFRSLDMNKHPATGGRVDALFRRKAANSMWKIAQVRVAQRGSESLLIKKQSRTHPQF